MADIKGGYGTSNQAFTITLTSLATGAYRGSAVVDNSVNKFLDAFVQVTISTGTLAAISDRACYVYSYASADGGVTYTDGVSGTDSAVTVVDPPNFRLLGVVSTPNSTVAANWTSGLLSVATAYGGFLPERWGIVVKNVTGRTLVGGSALWQGLYAVA